MLIIPWIIVGLLAGILARNILIASSETRMTDVVIGIVGAVGVGWASNGFAIALITGLNLFSVPAAFVGAWLLIVSFRHARRGRYRGRGAWGART